MPKLCLTLAETSPEELARKIRQYTGRVSLIEVRLDYLPQPQWPDLPRDSGSEFVATYRPEREGGRYQGKEEDRLEELRRAARAGFHWVDLEHDVSAIPDLPDSTRLVRSLHRFDGFPRDLEQAYRKLRSTKGEVFKLAVPVSSSHELARLLTFMETAQGRRVVLGMGSLGQPSRFLGAFLENEWTYVAEQAEEAAAPGQFELSQAQGDYRWEHWTNPPDLYGVIGNPVAHSLSPGLHNRLFDHYDLPHLYLPLPLTDLQPWFQYVSQTRLCFQGFSVTAPFKVEATRFAAKCRSAGPAVNTLVHTPQGWEGLNTDYDGFLNPLLSRKYRLRGKRALVLGNGGVAHTAVAALQQQGVKVTVVGRDLQKVLRLTRASGCRGATFVDLPLEADLCINTTPVGQHPQTEECPLPEKQVDFDLVYDLIYQPEHTRLLELARSRGAVTISGLEMFAQQAALQFQAWTGRRVDPQLVQAILRDLLR